MVQYKLQKGVNGEYCAVTIVGQNNSIPFDPANTDFLQYQKWLSEGNVPLPPDEPTLPETV
jgi:hypothetical protein